MQKHVLLTGSNGLLGQKLVSQLAGRLNVKLMATSRGVNRHPDREGYIYEPADLTVADDWEKIFSEHKPTELIHAAAMTQVDLCEKERELCDEINIESVKRLVELCKKHKTRMIFISTDFIFSGNEGPYLETDQPDPVNYYGQSKLKAEQYIMESGVDYVILRTILLYGITPAMSRSNIVLWVKDSLSKHKDIRVVNDQFRSPTLVEDLASATVSSIMKPVKGIYHISGPEMMSVIDIALEVADFWNLDKSLISEIDSTSLNQAAKRPPKTGFIILKAQTELEYKPHTLRAGLGVLDKQIRELAVQ